MSLKLTIIPALLTAILVATSARAQDAEPTHASADDATTGISNSDRGPTSIWMLLPASAGELPRWVEPSTAALNHELARHAPFLDPGGLRARLEQRVSTQPARLTNLQIDAWMSHSRSAIIHLSSMEYAQARQDLLETEAISSRAAVELNREDHRAHAVLETCLYLVRVFVETDQYARAEEHARECRMLVPGLTANALEQTPEVNEVLRHVDEAMRHEPRGQLRVESTPSGCTVRLNGLVFGETPFSLDDMARGDYRLQVECEDNVRGRVHHVRIGNEETVVRVDARFEQAFETRPIPHLHYPNADQSREHRMLDALRLAHDGSASHVLLFVPVQDGVRIDRVDVATQTLVASVRVPVNPRAMPPIARALVVPVVRALMASRSIDFMVSPPAAFEPWEGPHSKPAIRVSSEQASLAALAAGEPVAEGIMPVSRRERRSGRHATLGWAIAGAGVAALGLGYALEARSRGLGDRYARAEPSDPDFTSRQSDWQSSRYPVYGLAALGGVAASVGLGYALPARDGVPWPAWLSGVAGLGLLASGVVVGLGAHSCGNIASDRVGCVARGKSVDLAVLLSMTGAPLLSVPLSYLLLPAGSGVSARLDLSRTRAGLVLEGRL